MSGQRPDGINHIGMATNKSLKKWNTKFTTGRLEVEVPILSVYVNDIRTVKYNIKMVSEFADHPINRNQILSMLINLGYVMKFDFGWGPL